MSWGGLAPSDTGIRYTALKQTNKQFDRMEARVRQKKGVGDIKVANYKGTLLVREYQKIKI